MKIYTKKGDSGKTSILGGQNIDKHNVRLEAYGTVDELSANVGWLRDQDIKKTYKKDLISIQETLFTIGSHLATDKTKSKIKLPEISDNEIEMLENRIDKMDEKLPEMRNFYTGRRSSCRFGSTFGKNRLQKG